MAGTDWPRPELLMMHHARMVAALDVLRNQPLGLVPPEFDAVTVEELEARLVELRDELDLEVCMALAASFEATRRTDYRFRARSRLKDAASRSLREIHDDCGDEIWLEDLLDRWKQVSGKTQAIGLLKQAFGFRHWLAHGRHWSQKSGIVAPAPDDFVERWQAVIDLLQAHGFPKS